MPTGYFDIETQYLFDEVGGRENLDKLRLSVACLIIDEEPPVFFEEGDVHGLLDELSGLDLIVGHNLLRFDYPVLAPYVDYDVTRRLAPKTTDTLLDIYNKTGIRVSLNNLARNNIGFFKSGAAKDMPALWRAGHKDLVKKYCANDVELTKGIYLFGRQNGYVHFTKKSYGDPTGGERVKLEVGW